MSEDFRDKVHNFIYGDMSIDEKRRRLLKDICTYAMNVLHIEDLDWICDDDGIVCEDGTYYNAVNVNLYELVGTLAKIDSIK